jgi:hypothetical protein
VRRSATLATAAVLVALLGLAAAAYATENFDAPGTPALLTESYEPQNAIAGDVTGTAVPDLITMANYPTPTLDIVRGTGAGTFGSVFSYVQTQSNTGQRAWAFAVGPIDDQPLYEDIAEVELGSSKTDVFINQHSGGSFSTTPTQTLTTPSSGADMDMALGDFNGDGWDDLVVGANTSGASPNTGELEVYLNSGTGTFPSTPSQTLALSSATGFGTEGTSILNVATGDFTGNGRDDIAAIYYDESSESEDLAIWLAGPNGAFPASPTHSGVSVGTEGRFNYVAGTSPESAYHLYVGDVSGDGKPDLVWLVGPGTPPAPRIDFFENDGSGSFSTPEVITPPRASGLAAASAALTDFTGDGRADLVFADGSEGLLAYQATVGGQLSTSPQTIATTGFTPGAVAAIDLNGDGVPDLAVFDDAGADNKVYPLLNSATPPVYTLAPSQDFGTVPIDTLGAAETFTVTNTGPSDLDITSAAATGDFLKTADSCTGQSVAQSASCAITIRFAPTATGSRTGSLTIEDNTAAQTHTVSLTGTGAAFPAGSTGAAGATGAAGVAGATGAAGVAGATGAAGVAGPTGAAGVAGTAGPAGPAGPAGEIELVTCTNVTKKVKGKTNTSKKCTTQLTSSPQTFTESSARASVSRAGHVYATGSLHDGRLTLRASRKLAAGRYTLELTVGSGKTKQTASQPITIAQTIKID